MEAAGLIYANSLHHLDHVAPLCTLLDIPMIVTDPKIYQIAAEYYPQLVAYETDEIHLINFIADRFNVLISCLPACLLSKVFLMLEHLYQKPLTTIWCPHGSSDKGYDYAGKVGLGEEQYAFVYGQKMRDFFREKNIFPNLKEIISLGNYRKHHFDNVKPLYIDIFCEKVASQFTQDKKLILYAPTWDDDLQTKNVIEIATHLIEHLPASYNLLIKVHPNLTLQRGIEVDRFIEQYQHHENVAFLTDFPLIYPILENTDIYIGDRSSIGYDFLAFERPMFFIDSRADYPLSQCGLTVDPSSMDEFFHIMEDHLAEDQTPFNQLRSDLYAYTFDPLSDPQTIKEQFSKIKSLSGQEPIL